MKYSDEIIQRVKDATDIVALVGEYVPLKKAGSSFKGLCPFHSEKSPSFMVSPSRNSFHCFGCGKGGNAITFLMEMEKASFPEALKLLAEKSGVALPASSESFRDEEGDRKRERLQTLNEFAGKFFHDKLLSAEGQGAREYFKGRGFTKETAVQFQIGYAPAGWEALKNAAQKAGYTQEELLLGGLIVHNEEKGSFYDKFRDRLIFPVRNNYDKIIAFGGRALAEEGGPKYLNSPETPLFKKGECLYLLDVAREAVRQKGYVLVVEGYFDALALHFHGFSNAVATLGTALTAAHARLIHRYANEVVLLYDADEAGQAAVLRGFEPLLQAGLAVRVLVLPDTKDPDEYLRKHPKEEMEGLLTKAPDFFRWRASFLKTKLKGAPAEEKVRALKGLVPILLQVPDEAAVQAACAAVESELGLDNRDMLSIVNDERKRGPSARAAASRTLETPPPRAEEGKDAQMEADFLALLTEEDGAFVPWAVKELPPEVFFDGKLKALFERVRSGALSWRDLTSAPELQAAFLGIEARAKREVRETMLLELAEALRKRSLKRQMEDLKAQQLEAEKAGEAEKALELGQQYVALKRRISQGVEPA